MGQEFEYRTRVVVEGGTEETIFEPLEAGAPRIPARYKLAVEEHGRFRHGDRYRIDPQQVEDAVVPDAPAGTQIGGGAAADGAPAPARTKGIRAAKQPG